MDEVVSAIQKLVAVAGVYEVNTDAVISILNNALKDIANLPCQKHTTQNN